MKIDKWHDVDKQICVLGRNSWSVARLIQLAKGLSVFEIPIDCLYVYYIYDKMTIRDMVTHFKAVQDADLKYPIILDEDGELMDGRHRIMKALLNGDKSIKAVRFDENPTPCSVVEE